MAAEPWSSTKNWFALQSGSCKLPINPPFPSLKLRSKEGGFLFRFSHGYVLTQHRQDSEVSSGKSAKQRCANYFFLGEDKRGKITTAEQLFCGLLPVSVQNQSLTKQHRLLFRTEKMPRGVKPDKEGPSPVWYLQDDVSKAALSQGERDGSDDQAACQPGKCKLALESITTSLSTLQPRCGLG